MCRENRSLFLFVLAALLFCSVLGALRAGEPDWFLISQTELERLKTISTAWEQDRLNWLSQAHNLKAESANSNALLRQEREHTLNLRQSLRALEAVRLTELSLLNGEIAGEKQRTAALKGQRNLAIAIAVALALALIVPKAIKILRLLKVIPV